MVQPQLDQAAPVDPEDSRADEDPAPAETVDVVPQAREPEQSRVEAGLLEEEVEARHPDQAEEPTSEGQQAPASEPDQQDRRSLAIQARVSGQQGSA